MDRVSAFLAVNGDLMLENARALEARFQDMSPAEAERYEAQLGAYLRDAMTSYRAAQISFRANHPTHGREVERLIGRFDRDMAAN